MRRRRRRNEMINGEVEAEGWRRMGWREEEECGRIEKRRWKRKRIGR